LHYVENNRRIAADDLVLIDAGCEFECYASDITRTFPANGVFNERQRALYQIVLAAQLASIQAIRPGMTIAEIHQLAVNSLTTGLVESGLLAGPVEQAIAAETYKRFYMHKTSHWLGLDVHDVGRYKVGDNWRTLEPGMVLTVEPGLYIAAGTAGVDPAWWDLGVRIEDDVLVTATGHEVLSSGVPKTIAEIEALMRSPCLVDQL
ncbi:MAG: Xaa-Pro dipeptidase, partial [Cyanobacteria bacterium NC_groundwater_1444_Ag_S-0.65um_54_12]|nr:Xaa-Pro dipeptidase [Cyanobacteria bacterium NC_groundwater_1444_Ag_S-0.65um_54_12]